MIQQLSDASLEIRKEKLRIPLKDIHTQKLPGTKSKDLMKKIQESVSEIITKAGTGEIVFIDTKDLKELVKKLESRKWRKSHKDREIKQLVDSDNHRTDAQVRTDLSTDNFKSGKVSGMNFLLENEKTKEKEVVASIYTVDGVEKILLLKKVADNPIVARGFLALLRLKYRELHKKSKKQT